MYVRPLTRPFTVRRRLRSSQSLQLVGKSSAASDRLETASLESLLGWLVANGVQGIDSKRCIGLYDEGNGNRGVAALKKLSKGQQLLIVPLRLAIFDDPSDPENLANAPYEGAPWSIRLAWKLIKLKEDGESCPWWSYLASLPSTAVDGPLTTWSWGSVDALRVYRPMARQIDYALWLSSSAWSSIRSATSMAQQRGDEGGSKAAPKASVGRSRFEWALSVVHSRTFGTAGRRGGVGARMLVPFVDMLNHGGDIATSCLGDPDPTTFPMDNVRWDIVTKLGGEPLMVLTATRDIDPGEELLLSYGERSNDEWVLHYGFVPPRNPHDDVVIFDTIEDAIDWYLEKYIPKGVLAPEALQKSILNAYAASQQEEDGMTGVKANDHQEESEALRAERDSIKLLSGGRVDGRVAAAFAALHTYARAAGGPVHPNVQTHLAEAIASRAEEMLVDLRMAHGIDLVEDLKTLIDPSSLLQHPLECFEDSALDRHHNYEEILEHYLKEISSIASTLPATLVEQPAVYSAASSTTSSSASSSTVESDNESAINDQGQLKMFDLHENDAVDTTEAMVDTGALKEQELLMTLRNADPNAFQPTTNSIDGEEVCDDGDDKTALDGDLWRTNRTSLIPIAYRVYKCCILWDAVILGKKLQDPDGMKS